MNLRRQCSTADLSAALEHKCLETGLREIEGGGQGVVSGPHDDRVVHRADIYTCTAKCSMPNARPSRHMPGRLKASPYDDRHGRAAEGCPYDYEEHASNVEHTCT